MSKAVLISIRPEWTCLILSGEKTIEVRKTRPKLETPFKCYIYCTQGSEKLNVCDVIRTLYEANGTVIGEFVCDEIKTIDIPYPAYWTERHKRELDGSCITLQQVHSYLGSACGYGWHISELKIYDKPKELSEFMQCHKCEYYSGCKEHEYGCDGIYKVKRPPMSWCYVEELP